MDRYTYSIEERKFLAFSYIGSSIMVLLRDRSIKSKCNECDWYDVNEFLLQKIR